MHENLVVVDTKNMNVREPIGRKNITNVENSSLIIDSRLSCSMKATINFRTLSRNFRKPVTSTKFSNKRKKGVKRLRKDRANNANVWRDILNKDKAMVIKPTGKNFYSPYLVNLDTSTHISNTHSHLSSLYYFRFIIFW